LPLVAALAAAPLATILPSPARAAISSSGSVSPSPPQTAGADPVIGVTDIGRFTITPSSVVNSDQVTIGQQLSGIGFAVVSGFDTSTGSGAVWNTNNLVVGNSGTGTLEVLDGGLVTVDFAGNPGVGDLSVGLNPDSVGTIVVSGRGSILRIGDDTFIGHNPSGLGGSGTLIIRDEGFVIATNDAATGTDAVIVGLHGRIELDNGRLRGEVLNNNGAITGRGRVDAEQTISNLLAGRVQVGPGQRLVVNGGTAGGLGFDNDGEVNIVGGEIEFLERFTNSNAAATVTLRDGGAVHFPNSGFGFDSTAGVLATTSGVNDIFGTVRIQGAASRIVVAGRSTAVFHDPVTNSGGTIEVFPGSTPVFLQGLTTTASPVLAMHVTDPAQEPNVVEVAGGAQLAGSLQITLAGGYSPRVGDRFPVLQADRITGAFDSATIPNPAGGTQFHPVYTATDVTVLVAGAGDKTWGVDASGSASSGRNWLGGVAPGDVDDKVAFTTIITADRNVGIDAPLTAASLYFDDDNGYVIQGPETITLDVSRGNARIDVKNLHGTGAHAISAPLLLNDDTTIDVAPGASLSITGQMNAAPGVALTKSGAGDLAVRNVRADAFAIDGGAVHVLRGGRADGTSVVKSLTIAKDASLDLADNALVIDYTGTPSPLAQVREWIADKALTSSSAAANPSLALGYGESSAILGPAGGTFAGQPVDATAVLARLAMRGDANLDGAVSFPDLVALAQNYNNSTGAAVWTMGDFNYDGNVTFPDLVALAQNYGGALPSSPIAGALAAFQADLDAAVASVPEPAFLPVFAVISGLVHRRRRARA
jgi:T5SS/PEP-CTERM-associated repeat protein